MSRLYYLFGLILILGSLVCSSPVNAADKDEAKLYKDIVKSVNAKSVKNKKQSTDIIKLIDLYLGNFPKSRFRDDFWLLKAFIIGENKQYSKAMKELLALTKEFPSLIIEDDFLKAVNIFPNDLMRTDIQTFIVILKATYYRAFNRNRDAITHYEAAIQAVLKNPLVIESEPQLMFDLYHNMALSFIKIKKTNKARKNIRKYLTSDILITSEQKRKMRLLLKEINIKYASTRDPFASKFNPKKEKVSSRSGSKPYAGKKKQIDIYGTTLFLTGIVYDNNPYAFFTFNRKGYIKKTGDILKGLKITEITKSMVTLTNPKNGKRVRIKLGEGKVL